MIQWNFKMKKLCWKTIETLANWTELCSAKSEQTSQKKLFVLYYINIDKVEIFHVLQ